MEPGSGLYRVNQPAQASNGAAPPAGVDLEVWLDLLQNEYDCLVPRLRFLDLLLVRYGRKNSYLLPKRVR